MEAGVKRPSIQESADQGPEPCRDEGPVGGYHNIGDTRLRDLLHRRVPLRFRYRSLTRRKLSDCYVWFIMDKVVRCSVIPLLADLPFPPCTVPFSIHSIPWA